MSIVVNGWEATQSKDDIGRVYAKARYGQTEVLIPLDAVHLVATDAPRETSIASADASRRLALALIKYADGVDRKQTEATELPTDDTPQARWLREHPDALNFRDWWLTMQAALKGLPTDARGKANQAFQQALTEAMTQSK